jgi:signal transduction histidine kinase
MAVVIIATALILWPVPNLDVDVDLESGLVLAVVPGGAAERAGVRAGDRITHIYGYAWTDLDRQLTIYPLAWGSVETIPMTIERETATMAFRIPPDLPSASFQIEKAANTLIAVVCWITGYVLGVVRHHEKHGTVLVGWFWLALSGCLSTYVFGYYSSYPLAVVTAWLMISVLVPLGVYVHARYPPRPPRSDRQTDLTRKRILLLVSLMQVAGVLIIVIVRPSILAISDTLAIVLPVSLVVGLVGQGALLAADYRKMSAAPARRQVRLIGWACLSVATIWLTLRVGPALLGHDYPFNTAWIDSVSVLVPLAYLAGGTLPDLYRIERIAYRVVIYSSVTLALFGAAFGVVSWTGRSDPVILVWLATAGVLAYSPFHRLLSRALPVRLGLVTNHEPLRTTAARLATTLDPNRLATLLTTGIKEAFGSPPFAMYLAERGTTEVVQCFQCERLTAPPTIVTATLREALRQYSGVIERRTLEMVGDRTGQQLLDQIPGGVLWCPLKNVEGNVLALLVIGMRSDVDPYRTEDIDALRMLLDAATLAFANSATAEAYREAEGAVRQLYQRLRQAQDDTARAIARELHDEIINITVRLNIQSLERLTDRVHDQAVLDEVQMLLDSERTLAHMLRQICESLYPTGGDDPFGLPAILRQHVEQAQLAWEGTCRLVIERTPLAIDPRVQREVLRVVREAITNALKHAHASEIAVRLVYPAHGQGQIYVIVEDNGCGVIPKQQTGHWGVRNMHESAAVIGGKIHFRQLDQGLAVELSFPATHAPATQEVLA